MAYPEEADIVKSHHFFYLPYDCDAQRRPHARNVDFYPYGTPVIYKDGDKLVFGVIIAYAFLFIFSASTCTVRTYDAAIPWWNMPSSTASSDCASGTIRAYSVPTSPSSFLPRLEKDMSPR